MNIFDDLIDELKEENLLEETVKKPAKIDNNIAGKVNGDKIAFAPANETTKIAGDESFETPATDLEKQPPTSETEFYRQRAMDEVAFLQIVEHVFAGVEREQLKIVPKPYNDLGVKKVLHSFLQFLPDVDSNERSKAEFQLLEETESWHSSLSLRDERLTTAHLRRHCETSRPPLSSPALAALARFYRNSSYSEAVRDKFDLVVTRLLSKETGESRRKMVLTRDELVKHLTKLYAEWASVSLYSTEADDAGILEIARKFKDFMQEADDATDFDDLIKADFFTRLLSFKRSTNENFYAPLVTAAGVESNVRIGNRYVELLETEKQKGNTDILRDRYGFAHDSAISEATAKTYSLIDLLKQRSPELNGEESIKRGTQANTVKVKSPISAETKESNPFKQSGSSKPSKWLIAAAVLAILITAAIYFGT